MVNQDLAARGRKRMKILLAAEKQFVQKGYARTTVEDIAKQAGIGKSTFYEYYSSKETLLKSILDIGGNRLFTALSQEYKKCSSVKAKISCTVYCCLLVSGLHGEFLNVCMPLFFKSKTNDISDCFENKIREPFCGIIRGLFVEGMNNGEIAEQDAGLLVDLFLGLLMAAVNYQRTNGGGSDLTFSEEDIQIDDDCLPLFKKTQYSEFCKNNALKITDLFWRGVGQG